MGLDTRYIPIFTLQEWFVDKNNGEPLEGGIVSFYNDNSRSTPKQVYELVSTGAPPSYTYQPIGSQLILSNVGTFVDGNGADIAPYLFPYDSNGNVELYYVVVQGSSGSPQFTREGVPNIASSDSGGNNPNLINHIPNGQFQLHNSHVPVPSGTTFAYGGSRGTVDITSVAPGGIFFERSNGSTAVDTITFDRFGFYSGGVFTASPRYALKIVRSTGANDNVCGLVVRFMDVYKFSNPDVDPSTQPTLTLLFNAFLGTGTSLTGVIINQIQYFGVGGSTTVVTQLGTAPTITDNDQQIAISFSYAPSISTTVGSNDDDFIEFEIALPANQTWDIEFTDLMLLNGTYTGNTVTDRQNLFPEVTNGQFLLEALSNIAPTTQSPYTSAYYPQDGSNLYLPMIMTKNGMTYDYSSIGRIEGLMLDSTPSSNLLFCDGAIYLTSDYSPLGIPYSRLQQTLWSSTYNVNKFGNGPEFVNAYINSATTTQLILTTNTAGSQTTPANGGVSPGFTYGTTVAGKATINYRAYANAIGLATAISNFTTGTSASTSAAAGTSGMTVTETHYPSNHGYFYEFTVLALAAATYITGVGVNGKYFTFRNAGTSYYVWFKVNGEIDPTPGGTGILVDLSTMTGALAREVGSAIASAINASQTNVVTCVAAAGIPASSYFTFNANSAQYVAWYKVNGVGTQPTVVGTSKYIQVTLTGAETAAQVATKTQIAINSLYFAVPDLRDMFLRGSDQANVITWDIDKPNRFAYATALNGGLIGTFELDAIYAHRHALAGGGTDLGILSATIKGEDLGRAALAGSIDFTGGTESRPVNATVLWYIRY